MEMGGARMRRTMYAMVTFIQVMRYVHYPKYKGKIGTREREREGGRQKLIMEY